MMTLEQALQSPDPRQALLQGKVRFEGWDFLEEKIADLLNDACVEAATDIVEPDDDNSDEQLDRMYGIAEALEVAFLRHLARTKMKETS